MAKKLEAPPATAPSKPVRRRAIATAPEHSQTNMRLEKRKRDKEKFLKVLETHLGIISYAAEDAGVNRRTVYEWMDQDPDFARRVRDINEKQVDFVERKLLENIREKDTRAIIFYMGTKGRNRGYTTRVEVTTPAGEPMRTVNANTHTIVDVDEAREEMSDKAMAKAVRAALRFSPEVFGESVRTAVAEGNIDRA